MDRKVLIWDFHGGDKKGEKLSLHHSSGTGVHINHHYGDGSGTVYEEDLFLSLEAAKALGEELRLLEVVND